MKLKQLLTTLAAAVGLTTAATAATPVAVWDGDFGTTTKGNYTLNANGNAVASDGSIITIDQSKGVLITATGTNPFGNHCSTTIIKFSGYANPSSGAQALVADTDGNPVYHGIAAQANGNAQAIWGTSLWNNGKITDGSFALSADTTHKLAFAWRRSSGSGTETQQGTKFYLDGTQKAYWSGLFGQYAPTGVVIGGPSDTAITDVSAATGMKIVAIAIFDSALSKSDIDSYRFPSEIHDYETTVTGDANFSELTWTPEKPEGGFAATSFLTINNASTATVTIDEALTAAKIIVVGEGATTLAKGDVAVSVATYDFSGATGDMAVSFDTGASSVISGPDTVLAGVSDPTLTIASDNVLTVKSGSLKEEKTTNNGTLNFDGGTAESPIIYDTKKAASDPGTMTIASGAYMRAVTYNNKKGFVVTGAGADVSTMEIRTQSGGQGMPSNARIRSVKLVVSNFTGGNALWLESTSECLDASVDLVVDSNVKINVAGLTVGAVSGAGAIQKGGSGALTVKPSTDATFSGACSEVAFTLAGTAVQTISGNYTAALTVNEGGRVKITGSANPSSIANSGTVTLDYADEKTFATAITGEGAVTKDGAGTLSVTPGQFGDNLVTIAGGSLKFTLTAEQIKAGVVLCQTEAEAETIKANIVIVNEAGEELEGNFTKEGNALSFKVNCSDVYITIDSSGLDWGDAREEYGWIDSPESTLVITNDSPETADAWLDFSAGIVAKSIKIVHVDEGADTYIGSDSFAYMTVGSYDFTEAPDVFIDFFDSVTREMQLVTGTPIAGIENVKAANLGLKAAEFGLYTDATHIWLCRKIDDVTRVSPVTGEVQAFTNFFVGVNYGYGWIADWADKSNWRTAKDGLLAPYQYEKYPQSTEAQDSNWYPACFDGDVIGKYNGYTDITCETVEGWNTKLDFRNGVNVTIGRQKKFANQFMWIDETSSVTIDAVGGSSTQYGYVFDVAGALTIGEIEQDQPITFTYNLGENATVTYTNGVKYGEHALNGGKLIAEGAGISVPVTVTNNVTIATPAVGKITIAPESTLTLESTAEDDLLINDFTNDGTFEVSAGTLVFMPGVTAGTVQTSGTGKVIYGQTVTINDCGKIAVEAGATADDVRLFDIGGTPVAVTKVEGGYAYYEWDVTGKNCWWDYEFNGNVTSVGTDTGTMTNEGTTPYYNEDETALRVGYGTPWRDASYPEEFTAVIYGKMVNNNGHMEIGFGSTTSGTKYGVVIACGDPAKDEVNLHITSVKSVLTTVPMTVTDPYDTDHLYAFTCQTVDEKTKVSVYLDGKFLQAYTFGSKITLGSGFQVGSIHGGGLSGCIKATTANDHADLDFLRVYQTVLTAETMTKYAEKYPYTSKSGSSVRTFDDSLDQTWVAAEADKVWTVTPFEETAYTTNIALAGSTVTVSASATAEVTMNLTEATTYESLTIGEGSDITIKAGDEAVEPTITGITSIKANVTVDYDAIKIGTVEVAAEKTLTFDFTDFPFNTYYASATIAYTGATSGEGTITAKGLPTEGVRTVTFEKNASTDQYELKIVVDAPFVYTIGATEETGTWTLGVDGEEVTQEIVDANPKVPVWKKGDGSMTNVVLNRTYFVKEGTMVAGNATEKTGTVTVDSGATFDFNGKADGFITVNLNGGSLVNNGGEMGTGSRQMNGIALTEDSTIGGTGNFGLISGGWGANTLNLGGKSLTKIDSNTFWLTHTTVTNGTLNVTGGTIKPTGSEVTFTSDAALVLTQGTTLDNATTLNIGAITADEATINNTGTITPFTLTGSATLTGNGNWGTNTLANGASVTVGEKRDFTFAGAGTVNVTLTADEIADGAPITVFTLGEDATTEVGTITYNGKDITEQCGKSGNQITSLPSFEATVGTTYYLTLAEALDAAEDEAQITLLKDVTFAPNGAYTINKTIYLTLDGHNLTGNGKKTFEVVNNGLLSFDAEGSTVTGVRVNVGKATNDNGSLWINGGTWTIDDNTLVHVNGTCSNCTVYVQSATMTSNGDNAIQLCGAGSFTINGGTITGATAVYAKAGTIQISAELVANGEKKDYKYSADGANATGDALVIDNCGYPEGPATVTLLDGTTLSSVNNAKMGYYVYNSSEEGTVTKPAELEVNAPAGYGWDFGTTLAKMLKYYAIVYADDQPYTWAGLGTGDAFYAKGVTVDATTAGVTNIGGQVYYVSKLLRKGDPNDLVCEFEYDGTTLTKKDGATLGVTIGADNSLSYQVTTGEPYTLDSLGHACIGGIYYTAYVPAGPTPVPGSDTKVTPVPGEENTYKLEPGEGKTVVEVEGVKDGDTLVVDATVTAIQVVGGEQSGAIIKVRNSGDTADVPNDAMYGWDGNSFGTALNPDAEVEVGEETIPVTPAVDTTAETPVGVTDTQASVAMRTIPGLTYQLIRGDEPGVIETPLTTEGAVKTATGVATTLVDTAKPDGKAFYKVQVTK